MFYGNIGKWRLVEVKYSVVLGLFCSLQPVGKDSKLNIQRAVSLKKAKDLTKAFSDTLGGVL